ncbi:unnamed protein product [Adineta steineri]|uniref:Uncharacterized protein n=1 Tax=Adineta steineri TaxID=433720 RepID=A0A814P3R7_9BILA|nr:unnamed protein product [Adineta steineri]CAF4128683.1 unnamed protein product [Adineta steineri]
MTKMDCYAALFKVLPKYGVYSKYCQSSNAIKLSEEDCSCQTHQYQVKPFTNFLYFKTLSGITVQISSYVTCNYFSEERAFLLTSLVDSSLSASL